MSDVEAAEKRLEYAIARLEAAIKARAQTAPAADVGVSQTEDGKTPRDSTLRDSTLRDVTGRVDSAIGNLRRVLGE
ncbi:hypothetical protein JYT88_01410 [Rhodospirillaceae bacterium AH-315-P19]|nr:hypothetical protein [Rhodospirillaceae bacterium AH-315-P19]